MEQSSVKQSWLQHPLLREYGPEEHIPWYLWLFKNRFARFVILGWTVLTTTCVYYGWQSLSIMLFKANYYDYKCDGHELVIGEAYDCQEQYQAIQSLYIVCLASEFSGSLPAGFLFDYLGPLATGACGMVMFFVGWIMLLYSSQSVPMYIPAMMLSTGAVNIIAFPSLILSDLFPRNQGLNMAYVVAAQTGATAVAPTLAAIWNMHPSWTFTSLMWGYLLFLGVPTCVLFILTLPISRHEVLRLNPLKKSFEKEETLVEIPQTQIRNRVESHSSYAGGFGEEEEVELVPLTDPPQGRDHSYSMSRAEVEVSAGLVEEGSSLEKASWRNLLKEMLTIDWSIFCLYYCIQALQLGYYPTTVLGEYGEGPSNVLGYMMPLQALFGIVIGIVVDYTTTLPICIFINTLVVLVYVLAVIPTIKLQYLTSALFVLGVSFIYTTKYTYASEAFKPDNFGMLVGIMGFLAGILTLILIPIKNTNQYKIICICFAVISGLIYLILIYLWIRLKKIKRRQAAEKSNISVEATEERSLFIA